MKKKIIKKETPVVFACLENDSAGYNDDINFNAYFANDRFVRRTDDSVRRLENTRTCYLPGGHAYVKNRFLLTRGYNGAFRLTIVVAPEKCVSNYAKLTNFRFVRFITSLRVV